MHSVPQELLKQYVQSQHFTSTADIMDAMREMFREQVMEVEMDEELGWERCQRAAEENASPNYHNSYSQKTVKTQLGEIDIKGYDFTHTTPAEIHKLEKWINNYPREIFDYYTSADLYAASLNSLMSA